MNRKKQIGSGPTVGIVILGLVFLTGCVKKEGIATKGQVSNLTSGGTPTPDPSSSPAAGIPGVGSAALKNFSQYYNALRLATGNVKQQPVTVTIAGKKGVASTAATYFAQAGLVLPQNTAPSSLNDAVTETYPKLSAYFMNDLIVADEARADGSRLVLNGVNTSQPTGFTKGVAETVGKSAIQVFLNRTATPADLIDFDTAYTTASGGSPPATLAAMNNIILVILGGVTSSSEFATSN